MRKHPNIAQKIYLKIKDFLDPIFGIILFVILFPVFLTFAILIKRDSKGPVFVPDHVRIGKNGKKFHMYKFRTMEIDLGKTPPSESFFYNMFKEKEDPRLTKFGKWLRNTDLDELPQLINIIKGEMHFTGPRCFQPEEEKYYKKKYPQLRTLINFRTKVKPGVTGLWQISGRNETTLDQRLILDKKEVFQIGPIQDSRIILSTIRNLITKKWH